MLKKVKNLKHRVRRLLESKERLRDDDQVLAIHVWVREMQALKFCSVEEVLKMETREFLHAFKDGHLSPQDSITRARRLLQEADPKLRGKAYLERHKEEVKMRKVKTLFDAD